MNIIQVMANIGIGIEKTVKFTASSIYSSVKFVFNVPRQVIKMGNDKRFASDHKFLYQVIFYHKGSSRLNAIEKLRTQYPDEYNSILDRINKDNIRLNIPTMEPV